MIAALLAGLLPPPMVATIATTALPLLDAENVSQNLSVFAPGVLTAKASSLESERLAAELPVEKAVELPLAQISQPIDPITGTLNLTKTVVGSSNANYSVTLTGPSFPSGQSFNIISGTNTITNLLMGVYTVTETSPGAGWTTIYTVGAVSSSASGVITVSNPTTITATAAGVITGTVFQDYNADGIFQPTGTYTTYVEYGQSGVLVTAYDRNGAIAGTATTTSTGNYTLTTTLSGPYRLEFTNLPAFYEPSRSGANNAGSTQFVSAPAGNVNFGIARPADYCQNNPLLCTPVYINGDASSSTEDAMYGLNYDGTGQTTLAFQNGIGATWGVAYKRDTKQLFAAGVVKRHSGLGGLGLGGIYVINNPASTSPVVTNFIDLDAAPYNLNLGTLPNNSGRGLPASVTAFNNDTLAFAAVGAQGIGDIDLTDDGNTLWAVNLYTATGNLASLIKLDVRSGSVPTSVTSYPLSAMSGLPTCTGGVLRPWALKFRNNRGYLGAVCSAENSLNRNNLQGYVLSFNPSNPISVNIEVTIPLTYAKGNVNTTSFAPQGNQWNPWYNTPSYLTAANFYGIPTPILSDIEFDQNGGMTIGFMDRSGMQLGAGNYPPTGTDPIVVIQIGGELLRACQNSSGVYVLEDKGSCGGIAGYSTTNNKGPGGGEFYNDNIPIPPEYHEEVAYGSLAQVPGNTQIVWGGMDPVHYDAGGLYWSFNATGERVRVTELWNGMNSISDGIGTVNGKFGKAVGQGDVEVLCDAAPIEIGNRVWYDVNNDGVQDPNEPPLAGIVVSLQTISGTITTTTSISGTYYFTREATTGAYSTTLRANTPYTITINPNQALLNGYSLTLPNTQALAGASVTSNDAISDVRDSDALLFSNIPTIYYTTGNAGQNNHGLDFGFTTQPSASMSILNNAPASLQIVKQVTGGASSSPFTLTVSGPSGYSVITTVTTSSARVITGLAPGTYTVTESSLPDAPFGFAWGTASYSPTNGAIALSIGMTGVVTITNPLTPTVQRFGDRLWLESDSDGFASTNFIGPVANYVLTATDVSGTVYTTTTDSNGLYTFTVPPGIYIVTYGLPPTGYQASSTPGGGMVNASSGGNDTSHSNNTVVTLNPSDIITTVDFAFGVIPTPMLHINKVATPTTVRSGDLVTYTITLTNDGTGVANNVTVLDRLPSEVTYVNAQSSAGTYDVITGVWTIATMAVGTQTLTITVRVK